MRLARSIGLTLAGSTAVAVCALAVPAVAASPDAPKTPPIPIGWPAVSSATQTASVNVAPGVVEYSETYQTADGPEHTQVLDIRLNRGGARLGTVESHDHVYDPADETTTSMGDRTGAVAGINGDFFAIHAAGSPLGAVVRDGVLWKSPRTQNFQAQLAVRDDGTAHIGRVDFSGTVRDAKAATAITSLNTIDDAAAGGISELTPQLGAAPVSAGTLVIGRLKGTRFVVDEVRTAATTVPALGPDQRALLGSGRGGDWLAANVHAGDKLTVTSSLSDAHATAMLSGATVLVRDHAVYDDPTGSPPSGRNPETMVGVSADGTHVLLVVIDGRQASSIGVTPLEASQYLVAHHADAGILLDGGGSSTLATRLPGTASLTIRNSVSDSTGERPVANGLFVYRAA